MSDKRYYVYADSSIEADALELIHDYTADVSPLANPIKSNTKKWRVFLKKEGDIKHLDYDLEEIGAYLSPERIIEFESEMGGGCQFDLPHIQILNREVENSSYSIETSIIPSVGIYLSGVEIECHYINRIDAASSITTKIYATTHNADGLIAEIVFYGANKGAHAYCHMLGSKDINEDVESDTVFQGKKTFVATEHLMHQGIEVYKHDFISSETDVWIDVVFWADCIHEYSKIYMLYDTEEKFACSKRFDIIWEGV